MDKSIFELQQQEIMDLAETIKKINECLDIMNLSIQGLHDRVKELETKGKTND